MTSTMTVPAFQKYLSSNHHKKIVLYSSNQDWKKVSDPMNYNLQFKSIVACNMPNVVCLKNGDSVVYFEKVKSVVIDEDSSIAGTIIHVCCGDKNTVENDIRYTLLAN